jgi:ribonucleoside-diphosphate reductase alpha chain
MRVERIFTKGLRGDVFESLEWKKFDVCLKDHRSDKILYELNGIEAPTHWSQQSVDIMASKYFRRAEVPFKTKTSKKMPSDIDLSENDTDSWPDFVFPSVSADEEGVDVSHNGESSVKQVFHRLAGAWTFWGLLSGLLEDGDNTKENAQTFYDEIIYMLYNQVSAPNSPQFFNTGVWWAYGIEGRACGHSYADFDGKVHSSQDLYSRSQAHACFILGIEDNLLDENGIYDLLRREARIFKLGSGAGTNFSPLRAEGERLSGGGTSSGLISFLRIFDRAADCIKSGGITRRAAKMLVVDIDHPDILDYINWKSEEEKKAQALISAGYESDFNGEAYKTISGQNGNNSIAVSHDFMKAYQEEADWNTWWRTDKAKYTDEAGIVDMDAVKKYCKPARSYPSQKIWNKMIDSAWKCADPAIHFNGTMNDWNTLASDGKINSTNPCLAGDTLVYVVQDGEYQKIKIEDIKDPELIVVAYDFERKEIVEAKAKNLGITRSQAEIVKVKTKNGEIKLTPDHEVMTNRGWVKAKDLNAGDKVYKLKNKSL